LDIYTLIDRQTVDYMYRDNYSKEKAFKYNIERTNGYASAELFR